MNTNIMTLEKQLALAKINDPSVTAINFYINFLSAILLPLPYITMQLLVLTGTLLIIPITSLFAIKEIFPTIVQVYKERKKLHEDIKMGLLTQKVLQAEIENDSLTTDFDITIDRINKQVKQSPANENSIFEDAIKKLEKLVDTKLNGANILYSLYYHYGYLLIAQGYREQAFNYFLKVQSPHEKYTEAMYECGDYALCHLKDKKQAIDFYQKAYASTQDESVKEKLHFMISILSNSGGDVRDMVPVSTTRKEAIVPVDQSRRYRFFKEEPFTNKIMTDQAVVKNKHAIDQSLRLSTGG